MRSRFRKTVLDRYDQTLDSGDLCRDAFSVNPLPPFRLDLSVWALRRRQANAVDLWDGKSYQGTLAFFDGVAAISVTQASGPETPQLGVAVMGGRVGRSFDQNVIASLERMLALRVDLSGFYEMAGA